MLGRVSHRQLAPAVVGATIGSVALYEVLNFEGMVIHSLGHWLLLATWLISTFAIYAALPTQCWAARHRMPLTLAAALFLGIGALYIYAIDLPLPPPYPGARVVIDINLSGPTNELSAGPTYAVSSPAKIKEEQVSATAN